MSISNAQKAKPGKRASLPGSWIIRLGRFVWTTMWHLMMSRLAPRSQEGDYLRPESQFRRVVQSGTDGDFPAAARRYALIVGMGCPWAHRTLVLRALKGLEEAIPVIKVLPSPTAGGWVFEKDFDANGTTCRALADLYQVAQPGYSGRATVPVLWDTQTGAIVNNESAEIIEILNAAFNEFAVHAGLDLQPPDLEMAIAHWNAKIYPAVNNGVYRCGFAQTQAAYDRAVGDLFAALDEIDVALAHQRYLCGDRLTLADVRLFTTLFRFDAVYYGLFKCNRRRIQDYANLGGYLRDLYQLPGVAATCDLEAVKRDYYGNLFPLNPGGIIPDGPNVSDLNRPHGREGM
ncbi:MAG: glutathione S-transferase family protein [Synechococcales bacterium]|nr:glutathione S-transferase family protein [Synechococcales bacterium]